MSTDKAASSFTEGGASPVRKRGFGAKVKHSCVKYWWVHLIVFIAIACVIIFPVIFVGYPNIARQVIRDSSLTITSQYLTNPSNDTFNTNITTKVGSGSPLSGVSAPFTATISLGDDGGALYHLDVPQYTAKNGAVISVVQDNVQILDKDAFNEFSATVFKNDTLIVKLSGDSTIQAGKLQKVSITYDQRINVTGLNALSGLSVDDVELILSDPPAAAPKGTNAVANITIPNQSPISLELGDVVYQIAVDGENIGNSSLTDFTLKLGTNTYETYIYSDLTKVNGLISGNKKYQCGKLPLTLYNGVSSINGQVIEYFTYALHQGNTTTEIDLAPAIKKQFGNNADQILKGPCES